MELDLRWGGGLWFEDGGSVGGKDERVGKRKREKVRDFVVLPKTFF